MVKVMVNAVYIRTNLLMIGQSILVFILLLALIMALKFIVILIPIGLVAMISQAMGALFVRW